MIDELPANGNRRKTFSTYVEPSGRRVHTVTLPPFLWKIMGGVILSIVPVVWAASTQFADFKLTQLARDATASSFVEMRARLDNINQKLDSLDGKYITKEEDAQVAALANAKNVEQDIRIGEIKSDLIYLRDRIDRIAAHLGVSRGN